jgi:uroporphyrinogen-III decarboxylase
MRTLSSRQRLLTTISHVEPDHVPFVMHFHEYPQEELPPHLRHRDQVERTERLLAIGIDDILQVSPPWRMHPEVRARVWKERPAGEPYPVLHKVYETPKGPLTQVVKQTADWPHGDEVEVFSDHNIPRSTRFLIESEEDLERLPYILGPPSDEQIAEFRQWARQMKQEADRLGVALEGHCGSGADTAVWLCGIENFMIACQERPAFARELLRIIHEWEMKRLALLLDLGSCDIVVRRAWYEAPCFFSPKRFREFLFGSIRQEVEAVHQAGSRLQYIQTVGPQALIQEFLDLGIDILWGVDPVQGGADLPRIKRELGARICLFGGINSYVTLGYQSREEVTAAVRQAIEALAPGGGFALLPVCSIGKGISWEHVEWAIAAWRECGGYPLAVGG